MGFKSPCHLAYEFESRQGHHKNIGMKGEIKMPVFYILVFIAAYLLWLLLSSVYKPLGKLGHRIWKEHKDAMNEDDENENENKKE